MYQEDPIRLQRPDLEDGEAEEKPQLWDLIGCFRFIWSRLPAHPCKPYVE